METFSRPRPRRKAGPLGALFFCPPSAPYTAPRETRLRALLERIFVKPILLGFGRGRRYLWNQISAGGRAKH